MVKENRPQWTRGQAMTDINKPECWDCHRPYDTMVDFSLPYEVWQLIAPRRGDGLLCVECASARLESKGLRSVPIRFTSGAFAP